MDFSRYSERDANRSASVHRDIGEVGGGAEEERGQVAERDEGLRRGVELFE